MIARFQFCQGCRSFCCLVAKRVVDNNPEDIPHLALTGEQYKTHQIPKLKCFSSRLAVAFAQSIEARCQVENEDWVGAAPTGDSPTTSEWLTITSEWLTTTSEWITILLPTKLRIISEIKRYLEENDLICFKGYRTTTGLGEKKQTDIDAAICTFTLLYSGACSTCDTRKLWLSEFPQRANTSASYRWVCARETSAMELPSSLH